MTTPNVNRVIPAVGITSADTWSNGGGSSCLLTPLAWLGPPPSEARSKSIFMAAISMNTMSESMSDHFPRASNTASNLPRTRSGSKSGGAHRQKMVSVSLTYGHTPE
eukprot:scaffold39973_cov30-Tisochrysis_lutea.AAC.3